jgi:hypothetical protein
VHDVGVRAQTCASSRYCRIHAEDSPELLALGVSLRLLDLRCAPLILLDRLGARTCFGEIDRKVLGGLGVGILVPRLSVMSCKPVELQ